MVIPFTTDNENDKFSGRAVSSVITTKFTPNGADDYIFKNLMERLAETHAFTECIEKAGRVTFDYQQTRVTGKNNKVQKFQVVYNPACVGDKLVNFKCSAYTSHQYTQGYGLEGDFEY